LFTSGSSFWAWVRSAPNCSKPQGANYGTLLHADPPRASIVQQDQRYDKPAPRAELVKLPPGTLVADPAPQLEAPRVVEPSPVRFVEPPSQIMIEP
jgi:hypothetical protein